jgi:acyl carrier protein
MDTPWDTGFERLLRSAVPGIPADRPIEPGLDLTACGLNSLGIVKLMMSLERTYRIELALDLLGFATFTTPGTLWQAVRDALSLTANGGQS